MFAWKVRFVYFLLLGKTGLDLREGSGEAGEGNHLVFRPENKEWSTLILEVYLVSGGRWLFWRENLGVNHNGTQHLVNFQKESSFLPPFSFPHFSLCNHQKWTLAHFIWNILYLRAIAQTTANWRMSLQELGGIRKASGREHTDRMGRTLVPLLSDRPWGFPQLTPLVLTLHVLDTAFNSLYPPMSTLGVSDCYCNMLPHT